MKKSDHITALFIGSIFYYYKEDKQLSQLLINTALYILVNCPANFIGDA
jgi:hypothetical protein